MKKYVFNFLTIFLLLSNLTVPANAEVREVTGPDEHFLSLNGIDEFVEINAKPALYSLTQGTIAFWVRTKEFKGQTLFGVADNHQNGFSSDGISINVREDGRLDYAVIQGDEARSVSLSNDNKITDNDWHHIALVADHIGNIELYIDGSLVNMYEGFCCGPLDYFIGDALNANNIKIGVIGRLNKIAFAHIDMDEFSLYSRPLSAIEVAHLKDNALENADEGREIYYTFDQKEALVGSRSVANDYKDMSGNGNHGEFIKNVEVDEVTGPDDRYLSLNGIDEFVDIKAKSALYSLTQGTVAFWVRIQEFRFQTLFGVADNHQNGFSSDGISINVREDGSLDYGVIQGEEARSVSLSNDNKITDYDWHHIALVADHVGNIEFYIDGNLVNMYEGYCCGPLDYFIGDALNANNIKIGVIGRLDKMAYAHIDMDEFSFYSRPLSGIEVAQLKDNALENPDEGREIYYTFDEKKALTGSASVADDYEDMSGNGNHGEFVKYVKSSKPDDSGKALVLNGVDEYVRIFADEFVFTLPKGTISFWVKSNDLSKPACLFEVSDSTQVDFDSDFNFLYLSHGLLEYAVSEGGKAKATAEATTEIVDNNWHHVALVADNIGKVQMYLDGTEIYVIPRLIYPDPRDYFIGNAFKANSMNIGVLHRGGFFDHANILMDDFSIYARVFNNSEVLKLRDNTLENPNEGRVVYYTFEETEDLVGNSGANDFRDMSGNGNHGELRKILKDDGTFDRRGSLKTVDLLQNYPNPFTDNTSIQYNVLSATENLKFEVFDVEGRLVYKEELGDKTVGEYSILLNRKDLAKSNMYYYSLSSSSGFKLTKKLFVK